MNGVSAMRLYVAFSACAAAASLLGAQSKDPPPLMKTESGAAVSSVDAWENVRRPEILKTFETQMFGVRPVERPKSLKFETVISHHDALLSSAILKRIKISWSGPRGAQSMIATAFFPLSAKKSPAPCFVLIGGGGNATVSQRLPRDAQASPDDLDEKWPVEKIVARGYATVAFDATDVAEDDYSAFKADVFDCFQDPDDRTSESWGAISAWAWGASRVLDWLEAESLADAKHVSVVGISRFGKAALWAGASDSRFAMACAVCSGTCGAKLNRFDAEGAETLCGISRFRHWFCRNFDKWAGKDKTIPFDQHWMLALVAPRLLCVSSAIGDMQSCPEGEFQGALLSSPAWELYGKKGLVAQSFPGSAGGLQDGCVSYHLRAGGSDMRLCDWSRFMDFADRHGWRENGK